MKHRLAALFSVRPGEESRLLYLVGYAFFASAAYVFFSTAAYALFLAEFTAAKLPFTYIVSAVAVSLAGAVYAWLEGRTRLVRLVAATLVLMLIVTALVVAGLQLTGTPAVIFAVVIWCDVAFTLAGLGYWALAGRLFDIRQGKRLFGLITAGELAAGTAAGLSIPLVLRFADTPVLLWLGTAGLGLCLFSLRSIAGRFKEDLEGEGEEGAGDAAEEEDAGGGGGWRDMLRGRYVLLTLAFNAIWIVAYYFLDFAYLDQAEKRFPDEDELAAFLGVFNGVSQGAQLLLTAFFSGRLISRYGLKAGLIFPTGALAVALLALGVMRGLLGDVGLVFWLLILTKLAYGVLSSALINPASRLLYQPLDADRRSTFLTFVDSILTPLGGGLAGLLLLAVAGGDDPLLRLVAVMVAVWVAWTAVSRVLEREYAVALLAALNRRDLEGDELAFHDATSIAVLRRKLGSRRVGEVLYALELLERVGDEALPGLLIEALDHPAAEVRREALARIERLQVTASAPRIERLMAEDPSPAVRARAIRGYCELGAFDDIEDVAPYLDDADAEVARGSLVGLLRGGGIAGVLVAGNRLLEMQTAADASERARAAGALGEIAVRGFYQPLLKLLDDPDDEVRRAALEAAGKVGHPRLWPPVVASLSQRQCRRAAKRALVAGGEAAVPALEKGFTELAEQRETRLRILEICGRIGGEASTRFLLAQLDAAEGDLRLQVLASLRRLGWSATAGERARVNDVADLELRRAAGVLALLADLSPDEPRFRRALEIEVASAAERLLYLLSFVHDADRIESARGNLAHGSKERHAYALELLDTALPAEVKAPLLPLLSDRQPRQILAEMGGRYQPAEAPRWQRLSELFAEPRKPFTRAGVLAYAAFTRTAELIPAMRAGLDDREAIVRESARWALAQMEDAAPAEAGSKEETMAKLLTLERVVFLKAVGIFSDIPEDILAAVAEVASEKELAAGETVFSKGDLGRHLYVIVNGKICIHDGDRVVVVLDEGEVFGEMAILESEPRSMSARVEDDALLLVLGREQFWELMDDYSSITRGVVKMLCNRLRERTAGVP